jgi:zinc transporter ZupT
MNGAVSAGIWALAAFIGLYVAETHFFPHPHARSDEADPEAAHHHPPAAAHGFGGGAVVGLGLHSLLDGIAVGAGFSTGFLTGGVIVSLVVAHKLPVGIALMGALYHGGHQRARAVRYSAAVALFTPIAVIVSYALLRGVSASLQGAIVAAAGGSFLYVGAADLLPEGQASGLRRNTFAFLVGVGVMVVALLLVPE